jgi:hypothetical protein
MPYAETTGRPNVGDRVRHASGRVGTVIFVQRDCAASQAREQIRVRWDDKLGEAAPHLAKEYSLLRAKDTREPHPATALRKDN